MDRTLKRTEILRGRKNFDFILRNGKKIEGKLIRCYTTRELPINKTSDAVLFGVLIPSSISRAVDRNRIKRLIRESYRTNKAIVGVTIKNPACCAALLFIYNQKNVPYKKSLKFSQIEEDMVKILNIVSRMDVLN